MRIEKYVKDRSNKYIVYIDGEKFKLYDDVIVKYSLLFNKEIDEDKFNEIIEYNDKLNSYYLSIKYLTSKLKCEKEIKEYLKKKDISEKIIDETIVKLKEQGYLNNDVYLKAYINDAVNLSDKGPNKIKNELIKLDFYSEEIDEYLDKYSKEFWLEKISNIIEKKLKLNKSKSSYILRNKIVLEMTNLGYNKENILSVLNTYDIDDRDAYKIEYEKAKKKYSSKYEGYELDQHIKMYLYRKGFKIGGSYEE